MLLMPSSVCSGLRRTSGREKIRLQLQEAQGSRSQMSGVKANRLAVRTPPGMEIAPDGFPKTKGNPETEEFLHPSVIQTEEEKPLQPMSIRVGIGDDEVVALAGRRMTVGRTRQKGHRLGCPR